MVKQYPHIMTVSVYPAPTTDVEGNPVQGEPEAREVKCRAEANSGGQKVPVVGGQDIVAAWIVYMPKGTERIPDGANTVITWNGEILGQGQILRFYPGQLNCRAWL